MTRAPHSPDPRVSVIVRSYNRLPMLAKLLETLLVQEHDSFEIVVVEQSTVREPADVAQLELIAKDPRVHIFHHPPLGGPGARNTAVRASRGDILVFIDDDDLPERRDWLSTHEANFVDPKCLGVTGRFVVEGEGPRPYANMARAHRRVLSFDMFKWQRPYARTTQRKHVESLMGGNAAIRRSTLERFGLWDECTPIEDEPSLAYRINAEKSDEEYLLFDPEPRMIRRLDVPGGMNKRTMGGIPYARRVFAFMHNIIGHYFPLRFVLLYPLYFLYANYTVSDWILTDSQRFTTYRARTLELAKVWLILPLYWTGWLAAWWYRRLRYGEVPHRPLLEPLPARRSSQHIAPAPVLASRRALAEVQLAVDG